MFAGRTPSRKDLILASEAALPVRASQSLSRAFLRAGRNTIPLHASAFFLWWAGWWVRPDKRLETRMKPSDLAERAGFEPAGGC